jgi:hypothetical protein
MKYCSKCDQDKPYDQFYVANTRPGGFDAYCKSCKNLYYTNLCICGNRKKIKANFCKPCADIKRIGTTFSEETKKRMSEVQQKRWDDGFQYSEESIKKMSESHKGEKNYRYGQPGIYSGVYGEDHPMYGKKHTEESKAQMSISQKLRWENKK